LREHHLYPKLSNCSFFQTEVHYLGNVVSKEGIVVDLENIRAIKEWVAPQSVDEVRSFMSLIHQEILANFLSYDIVAKKGKRFEWTEECEARFE